MDSQVEEREQFTERTYPDGENGFAIRVLCRRLPFLFGDVEIDSLFASGKGQGNAVRLCCSDGTGRNLVRLPVAFYCYPHSIKYHDTLTGLREVFAEGERRFC